MRAENKISKVLGWFGTIFNSFVGTLNVLLLALFVVSAFSDRISPMRVTLIPYLGLAFPVFLFVNVCFFIYWLCVRKLPMIVVSIIVFAVCWIPISSYLPFHLKTEQLPQDDMIKVLSYNVMSFAYTGNTEKSPNKIIKYIAESGADIVCLQEYLASERTGLMNSKDIARALNMYPYISEIDFAPSKKNYKLGLAVFSKFPITKSRKIDYQSLYNGSSIHEINVRGKKLVLVNNHLESFKLTTQDRSKYSNMISHVTFEDFEALRGSVQQKLGEAFQIRAEQAEFVAKELHEANGYYTLVCGDFNDTPISYAHRTVQGNLIDAYSESGFGPGISYNQNFFYFRIDHIMHSSTMKAYNCQVDTRVKLSDHYPISCWLKLK